MATPLDWRNFVWNGGEKGDSNDLCYWLRVIANRPIFPWFGGKSRLARHIVPMVPKGGVYVEPFCGAASVFWNLDEPRPVEVLNDLNSDIINCFRCFQDREQFRDLAHRLRWTMYSWDEFRKALRIIKSDNANPVDRAWAWLVAHHQGFAGKATSDGNWGRAFTSSRGMASTSSRWNSYITLLKRYRDRISRVQLDNRDAVRLIEYWDTPDTVFYLDPPYTHASRKSRRDYTHEMSDGDHIGLVNSLLRVEGQVVLSGYENPIYAPLEAAGWDKRYIQTSCHAAGRVRGSKLRGQGSAKKHAPRVEVLWLKLRNPAPPLKVAS